MSRMERVKTKKESKFKLKLKSLSLREKVLLVISAIIFIFLIAEFAFIKPLMTKKINIQNEIVNLNLEKMQGISSNETNNKLISQYGADENKYNELIKEFSNNTSQQQIVKDLIQLGRDKNIQIENISFEKGQTESNYKKIIINSGTLNIQGGYSDILSFIKGMQNNNTEVNINGITISQKNNGLNQISKNGEYVATINIQYFNLVKGTGGNA